MKTVYGHEILTDDDDYIELVACATAMTAGLGPPGLTFVDLFPISKSLKFRNIQQTTVSLT